MSLANQLEQYQRQDQRRTRQTRIGSRQLRILAYMRQVDIAAFVTAAELRAHLKYRGPEIDVTCSLLGLVVRGLVDRNRERGFRLTDAGRSTR